MVERGERDASVEREWRELVARGDMQWLKGTFEELALLGGLWAGVPLPPKDELDGVWPPRRDNRQVVPKLPRKKRKEHP
jgi:hypothetical protein